MYYDLELIKDRLMFFAKKRHRRDICRRIRKAKTVHDLMAVIGNDFLWFCQFKDLEGALLWYKNMRNTEIEIIKPEDAIKTLNEIALQRAGIFERV